MQRTVRVNGQDLSLKPSANFMFYYRNARLSGEEKPDFQSDLKKLADMEKLKGTLSGLDPTNVFEVLEQTKLFEFSLIIRRMLWTFAYTANKNLLPFEEWCDELSEYDTTEASRTVMALVNENFFLMLGVQKPKGPQSV